MEVKFNLKLISDIDMYILYIYILIIKMKLKILKKLECKY